MFNPLVSDKNVLFWLWIEWVFIFLRLHLHCHLAKVANVANSVNSARADLKRNILFKTIGSVFWEFVQNVHWLINVQPIGKCYGFNLE